MEETKEQKSLYRLLQFGVYLSVCFDVYLFTFTKAFLHTQYVFVENLTYKVLSLPMYSSPIASKSFTLSLLCLVAIGTLSKKKVDLNPQKHILFPLIFGILILSISIWLYYKFPTSTSLNKINTLNLIYTACSIVGVVLLHVALDNISKIIHSNLGKDRWNIQQESFLQQTKASTNPYAINIPMLFYYNRKVNKGFISLENLFRGLLVCGVPGSGKSFGVLCL